MTRVEWTRYEGADIEHVVAMLICRENPRALVVRPSVGDGGIDLLVPTDVDGVVDVYQIKKFAENLKSGHKTQIKKSMARLKAYADDRFKVRNWYLTMPLNPTKENLEKFFNPEVAKYTWNGEWRGLTFVEVLVAKYPDVVDYYLRDGKERLATAVEFLTTAFAVPLPDKASGALVTPESVRDKLAAIQSLLDTDPLFRYAIHLDPKRPTSWPVDDLLVVSSQYGHVDPDMPCLTVHVYARFLEALNERPVPLSYQIKVDPGSELAEDLRMFRKYGTPFNAPMGTVNGTADLPGGLGGDVVEGSLAVHPAGGEPYDRRLGLVDGDGQVVAQVVMHMDAATFGVDQTGVRAHGVEDSGLFEFEMLTDLTAQTATMRLSNMSVDGKRPGDVLPALRFLAAFRSPNQLVVAMPFGPFHASPLSLDGVSTSWDLAMLEQHIRIVEALEVIQAHTSVEVRIPDEWTAAQLRTIMGTALVLGGGLAPQEPRRTPYQPVADLDLSEPVTLPIAFERPIEITLGGRRIELGTAYYCCSEATFDPSSVVMQDGIPFAMADPVEGAVMWAQREEPTQEEFVARATELLASK